MQIARHRALAPRAIYEVINLEGREEVRRPLGSLFWSGIAAGIGISASVLAEGILQRQRADGAWETYYEAPAGDINALRQEGWAFATGAEVDELNAGLAIVGLGATATLLVTGGGSATAKAGATALRVARRIGALSPRFLAELTDLGRIGLKPGGLWRYVFGRGPLDEAVDTARLARLETLGGDLTRVAENTISSSDSGMSSSGLRSRGWAPSVLRLESACTAAEPRCTDSPASRWKSIAPSE